LATAAITERQDESAPTYFRRKITMDVMNPTYQEVERALDLDLAKLTLTMVWARQNGYTVEPKLIETFGLSSHIVSLHLSDGETVADIEPCLQGGCGVIYDR
jgi:hypothetical protein